MTGIYYSSVLLRQEFDVPFPYLNAATDLVVQTGGSTASFTEVRPGRIRLAAPYTGDVSITRKTPQADPVVTFTNDSSWLAEDVNRALTQIRFGVEEVASRLDQSGVSLGSTSLPEPGSNDLFAVSTTVNIGGTPTVVWRTKTASEAATLLGVGVAIPTPVSGERMIFTNLSTNTYELVDKTTTKTRLGISQYQLESPISIGNGVVMSNGAKNGYLLVSLDDFKTSLGLLSAAYANTGTLVGNVVSLIQGASTPALPAVSGEYLTNVAKPVQWVRYVNATQASLTVPSDNSPVATLVGGTSFAQTSVGQTFATPPGGSVPTDRIRLTPGMYRADIEQIVKVPQGTDMLGYQLLVSLRDPANTGTDATNASPNFTSSQRFNFPRFSSINYYTSICWTVTFRIDAGSNADFLLRIRQVTGLSSLDIGGASTDFGGPTYTSPFARVTITKIA